MQRRSFESLFGVWLVVAGVCACTDGDASVSAPPPVRPSLGEEAPQVALDEQRLEDSLLEVPNGTVLVGICVTTDQEFVVATTTKRLGGLCSFALDGSLRGSRSLDCTFLATGSGREEVLAFRDDEWCVLAVPGLKTIRSADGDAIGAPELVVPRVGESNGWIGARRYYVGEVRPPLTLLQDAPLRSHEAAVDSPFGSVAAVAAADRERAVLTGGRGFSGPNDGRWTELAVLDLAAGTCVVRAIGEPAGTGLAVVGGRAWVSTAARGGGFLEASLTSDQLTKHDTGCVGRMQLRGDPRTSLLGIVVVDGDDPPLRVTCILYSIEVASIRELGRRSYVFRHGVPSMALIGQHQAIALAGAPGEARIVRFANARISATTK